MAQTVVLIIITALVALTLYGTSLLATKYPTVISGFKWGTTPEEIEEDKTWLQKFHKAMRLSAAVTMAGGIAAALLESNVWFIVFISVPALAASIYVTSTSPKRKTGALHDRRTKAVIIICVAVVMMVATPIIYIYNADLDVTFREERMEIAGIYGTAIRYSDVAGVTECESLPAISYRSNGFSLDKVNLGHFKTKNGQTVRLFTHSKKFFIRIETKGGDCLYLSKERPAATKRLYYEISRRCNGCDQKGRRRALPAEQQH